MDIKREIMLAEDRIGACGKKAREELYALLGKHGMNYFDRSQPEKYLEICKEILARWHTTNNFKVGDKVYVHPGSPTFAFTNYIRATVTEVDTGKWGYHLRAFEQDLPGIYMFNIWDKDLSPRTGKSNKPLPPEDIGNSSCT